MLTRGEDYAHQQPSLTKKKLRRMEITAGAPKYTHKAELSYKRMVADQVAGGPARKVGASATLERALR